MVGRRVLLRVEKGAGEARRASCSRSRTSTVRDERGVTRLDDVSLRRARRRDRRHRRRRRQRPVRAARGRSPASGAPDRAAGHASTASRSTSPASPTRRLRDRGLAHVPEDRHRMGLVMAFDEWENVDPRLSGRRRAIGSGPFLTSTRRDRATHAGKIEQLRHPPADSRAEDRQFLRRQPAEDRARPRDRARPERAAGRPADPRRRYRRHRVHPPAASSRCATAARRSCWSRSSSTRSASLSDRILVMFDGRIVGERDPERDGARDSAC